MRRYHRSLAPRTIAPIIALVHTAHSRIERLHRPHLVLHPALLHLRRHALHTWSHAHTSRAVLRASHPGLRHLLTARHNVLLHLGSLHLRHLELRIDGVLAWRRELLEIHVCAAGEELVGLEILPEGLGDRWGVAGDEVQVRGSARNGVGVEGRSWSGVSTRVVPTTRERVGGLSGMRRRLG